MKHQSLPSCYACLEVSPHNRKPAKNNIPSSSTHSFQHSFSPGMTLFALDSVCVAI
jgi:hypothetical protein